MRLFSLGRKTKPVVNEVSVDLLDTPWQLTLKHKQSERVVYIHCSSHLEAKDVEDRTRGLGWYSLGITWQTESPTLGLVDITS